MSNLKLTSSSDDRRCSKRFQSTTTLSFAVHEVEGPVVMNGSISDVSRSGLRITFDRPVRNRAVMSFDFEVNSVHVKVDSTTIWCEQSTDVDFIVGCELHRRLTIPEYIALCDFASEAAGYGIAS